MAIDPNIAMGVRPVEQPNVLGQMAQVMAMRQAQQEYENEGGLRNALTGGLPDDPSSLLKYGKQGRAVYESALKGRKEKLESDEKRNVMLGGFAGSVMENPTPEVFKFTLDRAENYGLMTKAQKQEVLAQYGGSPESIKAYASQIFKSSISAQAQQSDATSRRNADVTSGSGYGQLALAQEKAAREKQQLDAVLGIVSPAPVSSATSMPVDMGGGGVQTTQTPSASGVQTPATGVAPVTPPAGAAPVTPVTGAVGKPNVLATQVAPPLVTTPAQTTVNNLGQGSQKEQLVDQISRLARLPYADASRALEMKVKEFNVLYPTEKIEQDRQGNLITIVNGVAKPVLDARGLQVQGKPLTETAFEKSVGAEVGKDVVAFVKRAEAAPKNITKIDEALGILKSGGAVTGFGAEVRLNLERAKSLFGSDVKAGKRVVDTQILDALLGSDVFPSLQSMGLGSKNIDTPAEREFIRQVITGTIQLDNDALVRLTQIRRNVETNAIKEYNQKLDGGKLSSYAKAANQKLEKIEVPNPIIRSGRLKDGSLVNEYADGTIDYAKN
jgi:hypothetical protein